MGIPVLGDVITSQYDYSTDEQWTGRKWTNGKKLYWKKIGLPGFPNSTGTVVVSLSSLNIDKVIRVDPIYASSTTGPTFFNNRANAGATSCVNFLYRKSTSTFEIYVVGDQSMYDDNVAIIFYTCTDR
jgi:hypothetical protein